MRDIVNEMVVSRDVAQVFNIAIAVAVIFIVKGLSTFAQGYYLSKAGNSIVAEQQRKIYGHLLRQGVSFFQNIPSSELLLRVTHNAQAARSVIDTIVTGFVRDLFSLLGLVSVMFYQQPVLSFVALILGPMAIFGVRLLLRRVRRIMELELASLGQIIQIMQETTNGIRVIKAFALEGPMSDRMNKAVADVERRANGIARLESATSPIMETLSGLAIAGVLALSAVLVLEQGRTPGELMSFITALLLAYEPAKRLARMRVGIESGLIGARAMFELLDHPVSLLEGRNAVALPRGPGHVVLRNVQFGYSGEQVVLHDVSLQFPAGKMTALVGPSGSGKSTVINLVMRLYDPIGGSVEIDGVDVRHVTFPSLRERISYVSQDTFLFAGTVFYNIGLGKPGATEAEIVDAAKAADAHEFILSLEHGYHTHIVDNGGNLSGGQRQKLAIARAMLRDSQILILDEATSALDSQSEASIRSVLHKLMAGRTTIVIAHRLTTIAEADKIIVMEDGRLVEEGHQDVLLARDGLYRRLHRYQFEQGYHST
ncbi:ABC transporter ATP-binding protein/permease [Ciceribacter sp. RN22]|nr:ABC transporter ATP-binding protein/permease [Ciceribacter sp. RN22]